MGIATLRRHHGMVAPLAVGITSTLTRDQHNEIVNALRQAYEGQLKELREQITAAKPVKSKSVEAEKVEVETVQSYPNQQRGQQQRGR